MLDPIQLEKCKRVRILNAIVFVLCIPNTNRMQTEKINNGAKSSVIHVCFSDPANAAAAPLLNGVYVNSACTHEHPIGNRFCIA